jgi:hypothetical protein
MSLLVSIGIALLVGAVLAAIVSILFIWLGTRTAGVVAGWGRVAFAALAVTAVIWLLTALFSTVPVCGILGFLAGLGISLVIIKVLFGVSYSQALPIWLFNAGAQIVALLVALALLIGLGAFLRPAQPVTLWLPLLPSRPPSVAATPTPEPTVPTLTAAEPTATPERPTPTPKVGEPTATPRMEEATATTEMPTARPEEPTATAIARGLATVRAEVINLRAGPGTEYEVLDELDQGERLELLARTDDTRWLVVLAEEERTVGWVLADDVETDFDITTLPTIPLVKLPTKPPSGGFEIEYQGCIGGTSKNIGVVKGQVFDRQGRVIVGARVGIWLDGRWWDSPANPARTNEAGWYEWNLTVGQKVRFVSLNVGGQEVSFTPEGFEVEATGGCYQHVDFRER